MKKVEVVAAIIQHHGKILCCQREQNKLKYLSGKWEFPGGKVEDGETREEALIREIDEELEMAISDLDYALTVVHEYADFELTMHTFMATTESIEYTLHAHKSAVWSNPDELANFDWAAADLPIVDYIHRLV